MSAGRRYRLVVVGAGPGGYAAAFRAADLGLEVALIDREPDPGGVCLYRGCIPSKALLHVAKLLDEAQAAANWGVRFDEPRIDLARLGAWKGEVVSKLTGGLGQLARQRKVHYLRGTAAFRDAGTLELRTAEGEAETLGFDQAVIATGSRPAQLPGFPPFSSRILDSTGALELQDIPRRLLVVGGGYIGLELGSVYAALGSRVTLVELTASLLPGADADLVRPLAARVAQRFEAVLLETRVAAIEESASAVRVKLEGGGRGEERSFDRALVCVGRRPNTEQLGLERTQVRLDAQGFIQVDSQLRTHEPALYAIGDAVGQPMLAHKAAHEGRVAVEAIAGEKVAFEPAAIPAVVFTDPEVAWCGLTEGEAKRQGREVAVTRFPWAASGRAATLDREDGLTKLVLDPSTERVLGVGLVGPGAGELIAEGVLAVEMAATAADLRLSIHPHPTLSETLMEAAELFFGASTHVWRRRRA
ncbi:MAG TPA: dihydrolipoyl dehydrogenase [Candidatus Polarisedimenticolaceae bacterium]|nr:dihydrolipoyl dehydrogenase [Candidatus Polarisedimenticolaceae bacterium]